MLAAAYVASEIVLPLIFAVAGKRHWAEGAPLGRRAASRTIATGLRCSAPTGRFSGHGHPKTRLTRGASASADRSRAVPTYKIALIRGGNELAQLAARSSFLTKAGPVYARVLRLGHCTLSGL